LVVIIAKFVESTTRYPYNFYSSNWHPEIWDLRVYIIISIFLYLFISYGIQVFWYDKGIRDDFEKIKPATLIGKAFRYIQFLSMWVLCGIIFVGGVSQAVFYEYSYSSITDDIFISYFRFDNMLMSALIVMFLMYILLEGKILITLLVRKLDERFDISGRLFPQIKRKNEEFQH